MHADRITAFFLGTDADTVERLQPLLQQACPSADLIACDRAGQAVDAARRPPEILILGNCSAEDREAAEAAVDEDGLPRWALFDLRPYGDMDESCVRLSLDDSSDTIGRILKVGLESHRLRRQNLQMTSDFRSVSRRMCHDLRTPLSCIQTVLSVLEMGGGAGPLPPTLVESASTSTQELARMIDQLAMLGRTWGAPSANASVNVQETFEEASRSIARRFSVDAVAIHAASSFPAASGVLIWVEYIWETYLAYAYQQLPEGEQIEVSSEETNAGHKRFTVTIPGAAGVASELSRAFLPFHLLADQRGRGRVDFALVQRFTRLMGGTCGAEVEGSAARLYFSLPA